MRTLNQAYFIPILVLISILSFLSTPSLADGQKHKGGNKFKKGHPVHEVDYHHRNKHTTHNKTHRKHHYGQSHHNKHHVHHVYNAHAYRHQNYNHYNKHHRYHYKPNHHSNHSRYFWGLHLNNLDIYLRD